MTAMNHKTLIFIPTYNEAENIEKIFLEIKSLSLGADFLFLDDNSPDGTGAIIDRIAGSSGNVFAIHRKGKQGIGSAHKAGINWAYDKGYETLVTMDCDFTHSPKYIADFIRHSPGFDIVIGSRYLEKDSLKTWNLFRKSLTRLAHFLTTVLLGMSYDSSGAFRLYNLHKIPHGVFKLITPDDYAFFFESLFILQLNGHTIREFPISLPSRTYGSSKMTFTDMFAGFGYLLLLSCRKLLNRRKFIYK